MCSEFCRSNFITLVRHINGKKGICGPEKEDFDISLFHTHSVSVDIKML